MIRSRFRPPFPRINRNSPLAKGLVFAGLGGGASTLKMADASGYGNDGTLTNMDPATDWVWVPELGRNGTRFAGTDDTIIAPYSASLGFTTAYTFAAWCYQESDRNWNVWFVRGTANTDDIEIYSSVSGQGLTVAHNRGNGGTFEYVSSDSNTGASGNGGWADMTHGGWHHLAVTFEASTLRVYFNGKQAGNTITGLIDPLNTNRTLRLGSTANTAFSATGAWCIGRMADACVFNRASPPGEISALADPSNVMLEVGGVPLILPPHRVSFPAAVAEPSGFKPYWARNVNTLIGGGV